MASHGLMAAGASGCGARLFTNISGSYTGTEAEPHVVGQLNGLKSQAQVPPDSSLMVSVLLPLAVEDEELELAVELELLLQAAASSPAAASAAVRAVHRRVTCLMWAFLH